MSLSCLRPSSMTRRTTRHLSGAIPPWSGVSGRVCSMPSLSGSTRPSLTSSSPRSCLTDGPRPARREGGAASGSTWRPSCPVLGFGCSSRTARRTAGRRTCGGEACDSDLRSSMVFTSLTISPVESPTVTTRRFSPTWTDVTITSERYLPASWTSGCIWPGGSSCARSIRMWARRAESGVVANPSRVVALGNASRELISTSTTGISGSTVPSERSRWMMASTSAIPSPSSTPGNSAFVVVIICSRRSPCSSVSV